MPLIRAVVCCADAASSLCRATAPANRSRSNASGTVDDGLGECRGQRHIKAERSGIGMAIAAGAL